MNQNREKFIQLLKNTKRSGIDETIEGIDKLGFFQAPASTIYHGCYDGGLLEHSLNVYQQMMYLRKVEIKIKPQLESELSEESCIIVSLLHDVCKSDLYEKTTKWRKDAENKWEQYETYKKVFKTLCIGHGTRSVVLLLRMGLQLTDQEITAINWHMGAFDISQYDDSSKGFNESCSNNALAATLVSADWLASKITERSLK